MSKKNILFVSCFVFLLSASGRAQQYSFFGGIKTGIAKSNMKWEYDNLEPIPTITWDDKTGAALRIFGELRTPYYLQLQAETGFTQKGITKSIPVTTVQYPDGTGQYIEVGASLNYISVCVLAKAAFDIPYAGIFILAGPQYNRILNKTFSAGMGVVFDEVNKSVWGISFGAGIELNSLLPLPVFIEYRYEQDLKDIFPPPLLSIYNRSHILLVGVSLR